MEPLRSTASNRVVGGRRLAAIAAGRMGREAAGRRARARTQGRMRVLVPKPQIARPGAECARPHIRSSGSAQTSTAVGPQGGIDRAAMAVYGARYRARPAVRPASAAPPSKLRCSALRRAHRRWRPAPNKSGAGGAIRSRAPRSPSLHGPGRSMQWRWPRRSPRPAASAGRNARKRGHRCSESSTGRSGAVHRGRVCRTRPRRSSASRFDSRAHREAKRWIRFHVKHSSRLAYRRWFHVEHHLCARQPT